MEAQSDQANRATRPVASCVEKPTTSGDVGSGQVTEANEDTSAASETASSDIATAESGQKTNQDAMSELQVHDEVVTGARQQSEQEQSASSSTEHTSSTEPATAPQASGEAQQAEQDQTGGSTDQPGSGGSPSIVVAQSADQPCPASVQFQTTGEEDSEPKSAERVEPPDIVSSEPASAGSRDRPSSPVIDEVPESKPSENTTAGPVQQPGSDTSTAGSTEAQTVETSTEPTTQPVEPQHSDRDREASITGPSSEATPAEVK